MDSTEKPDRGGCGFDLSDPVNSFVGTVGGVLRERRRFFSGVAASGSLRAPLVFAVTCLLISWFLGGISSSFVDRGFTVPDSSVFGLLLDRQFLAGTLGGVLVVVLSPVQALITLCFYSAIVHLLVMILMRERQTFGATLRVYCYATVAALVSWLPLVGGLATLYGLYLLVVGLCEVHGSTQETGPVTSTSTFG
jgi:hypothetical protein